MAIQAMLWSPELKEEDQEALVGTKGKGLEKEPEWEMVPIPETPKTPYHNFPMSPMTPRTKAFQTLQGSGGPSISTVKSPYAQYFDPPPKKAKKK
jgi:hypothetical protein